MNPVQEYIDDLKLYGRSYGHIRHVRTALKDLAIALKGSLASEFDVPLAASEKDIKHWIKAMQERRIEPYTISKNVSLVKTFYKYFMESPESEYRGLVRYNPCDRVFRALPKGRKQTIRPIKTVEEVSRFIRGTFKIRDRVINVLLAKLGPRRGELAALDLEDVDIGRETLRISKHLEDASREILPGRKNGVETLLPLDDEALRALKTYLATRPPSRDRALFLTNNNVRMDGRDINNVVKKWVAKTGINNNGARTEDKITAHYFRAWIERQLQKRGCDPDVIDYIRGDKATTMRGFYGRQVMDFEEIREEYLRTVPKFGI